MKDLDHIRLLQVPYREDWRFDGEPPTPEERFANYGWQVLSVLFDALDEPALTRGKRGWILAQMFNLTGLHDPAKVPGILRSWEFLPCSARTSAKPTGTACLGGDTVVPPSSILPARSVTYFQGALPQNSDRVAQASAADCAAGSTIVRLETHMPPGTPDSATSLYPQASDARLSIRGGITAPGRRTHWAWCRNRAVFCKTSPFTMSNGVKPSRGL